MRCVLVADVVALFNEIIMIKIDEKCSVYQCTNYMPMLMRPMPDSNIHFCPVRYSRHMNIVQRPWRLANI